MPYDVVIVIGSKTDLEKVKQSKMLSVLDEVGVSWELSAISAHRNLDDLATFTRRCVTEGTLVFIAAAGMAAALSGTMSGALGGLKPVLGVALSGSTLDGIDALLAQVRLPKGCPVGVIGLDEAGLYNAALFACSIIALLRPQLLEKLASFLETSNKQPAIGLLASDKKEGE